MTGQALRPRGHWTMRNVADVFNFDFQHTYPMRRALMRRLGQEAFGGGTNIRESARLVPDDQLWRWDELRRVLDGQDLQQRQITEYGDASARQQLLRSLVRQIGVIAEVASRPTAKSNAWSVPDRDPAPISLVDFRAGQLRARIWWLDATSRGPVCPIRIPITSEAAGPARVLNPFGSDVAHHERLMAEAWARRIGGAA